MHATDVNPLFYSALLLSALPVPLLRQVYFLVFFLNLFLSPFSVRLFEVLEKSLGALGSILQPFGEHLGVMLVTFLG